MMKGSRPIPTETPASDLRPADSALGAAYGNLMRTLISKKPSTVAQDAINALSGSVDDLFRLIGSLGRGALSAESLDKIVSLKSVGMLAHVTIAHPGSSCR
jgi:hypothetical protein